MENPAGNGSWPASSQLVNVEARPGSEAWTASVVSEDIVEGESTQEVGRGEPLNGATPRGTGASEGRLEAGPDRPARYGQGTRLPEGWRLLHLIAGNHAAALGL